MKHIKLPSLTSFLSLRRVISIAIWSVAIAASTYNLSAGSGPSVYTAYTTIGPLQTATTNSTTVSGANFVSQSIVLVNGSAVTTAYSSATTLIAQIPVAATATGTVAVTVQNPGGVLSTAFQLKIAVNTVVVSAPGTARLNGTLQMTSTVTGTPATSVTWSLTGAGSISSSGLYQAPATMPAIASVTVTAALVANPSIAGSYSFSLMNPVPSLYSAYTVAGPLQTATTNATTISGIGFVPQSVVLVNGSAVTTAYQSSTTLVAQIPVSGTATGTFPVAVQNPDPGGSTTAAFQLKIAVDTITLAATTSDGKNTGTARLNGTAQLSATVSGTPSTAVTWSITGAGTISSSGLYQAPATMPANANVTATATLVANTAISSSYAFSLINPVPSLYSAYTAAGSLQTATTNATTISGVGFVPQSVVLVNGSPVTTAYQSSTTLIAQIPVSAAATGAFPVAVQNPAPGGSTTAAYQLKIAVNTITLSASTSDGQNTGTARLGGTAQMTATVSGTPATAVTWSITGAGTISSTGLYQAPATMPANTNVTAIATLTANTAISASYPFSLTNPIPSIYSAYTVAGPLQTATTNPTTVSGIGFVPQSTVLVNGSPVSAVYQSSTVLIAQIPVSGTATGTFPVTVQNPSPGGGVSVAYQLKIATNSITLSATSSDGVNTGLARLSGTVQLNATVAGTPATAVNWSINGAGTISSSGYYQAPAVMPANGSVIATATLASNSAITASYPFSLVNPVPSIYSAFTATGPLLTAITNPTIISGIGFVPQSTVLVNGSLVAAAYQSSTTLVAQIPVTATAKGTLPIVVQNPNPGGSMSPAVQIRIAPLTLQVGAFSAAGVNPASIQAGLQIQFSSTLSGSGNPTLSLPVQWTVQSGGGTVSPTGLYQAPAVPSSSSVSVTASLADDATVTGSYTVSLLNPTPVVNITSPTTLVPGTTNLITVGGRGFIPTTSIVVNGSPAATTYQSGTSLLVSINVPANQTLPVALVAQNPDPGAAQSSPFSVPVSPSSANVSAQVSLAPGQLIPPNFLGTSYEWGSEKTFEGSSLTGTNLIFRQMITNLMQGHDGPFLIRLGGNSTDTSGMYPASTVGPLAELANALPIQFLLGLNLGANNPQLAINEANYLLSAIPNSSIAAFEIGNEPDNYDSNGMRPPSYGLPDYFSDFATWNAAVTPVLPSTIQLMGPSWGWTALLAQGLVPFEQQEATNVSIVSQHFYGGYTDNGQSLPIDYLLGPAVSHQVATTVSPAVSLAHQNGQLFRIGEMNSVDNGGLNGVSNAFGAALWAVDTMFELSNVGVDGVNWHGSQSCPYCAFTFGATYTSSYRFNLQSVNPLYYGMLFFQMATQNGASLLPVTLQSTPNVKVWATQDKSGTIRVVILNKDETFTGNVSLALPGFGSAQGLRLLAPSYQSTSGISLGQQSFDGSLDGTLVGTQVTEAIPSTGGTYTIPVQPTSAILLTFTK